MIVNNTLLESRPSHFSYSDSRLAKSIIKFIDIVLALSPFVPIEVGNEMRTLQNTLQYKTESTLDEYIGQLQLKCKLKETEKRVHHSERTDKYGLGDSDK
jgi:hypothetical protein